MKTVSQILTSMKADQKNAEVMKTGFRELDEWLDGGFFKKEMIIIGAHTGVGKSQIAGQMMLNIASKGYKTAYFSLEISAEMIISRLVGASCNIKPTRLMYGMLTAEEQLQRMEGEAKVQALEYLMGFYDEVYELEKIIAEIKANEYEFIVIDFIQNVIAKGSDENQRLTQISLELQRVAKEKNCCILALSQLSNTVAREGAKGKILEYKGSGGIAMVADLGFFLERDEQSGFSTVQGVSLTLRKNRRGMSGQSFRLCFEAPGGRMYER